MLVGEMRKKTAVSTSATFLGFCWCHYRHKLGAKQLAGVEAGGMLKFLEAHMLMATPRPNFNGDFINWVWWSHKTES